MRNFYLLILLMASATISHSQQDFFLLKKKSKTLKRYAAGSFIVFKTTTRDWTSGMITKIRNDSFYVHEFALRYSMSGIDTVHFGIMGESLKNITVMPRPAAMVYYKNDRPVITHGHEKFAWIKNGMIFQVAGGGYLALNAFNAARDKERFFSRSNTPKLIVGVFVFLTGRVLQMSYKQHLEIGKKYHLEYIGISGGPVRGF